MGSFVSNTENGDTGGDRSRIAGEVPEEINMRSGADLGATITVSTKGGGKEVVLVTFQHVGVEVGTGERGGPELRGKTEERIEPMRRRRRKDFSRTGSAFRRRKGESSGRAEHMVMIQKTGIIRKK